MRTHIILWYLGIIMLANALFMGISAGISAITGDSALFPLTYSTIVCFLFGIFPLIFVTPSFEITNREGLFIVVSCWLISCLVGTMPYVLWGGIFTFSNAWFESVSGFTTTGSTIISDIEALSTGLLFWRSATHWMGGVGIIMFILAALPARGSAPMILYRNEVSHLVQDSFRFRTKRTLQILLSVYIGLTVLQTVVMMIQGMSLFDAITHSFATIATGGFSTKNTSIAFFQNPALEVTIIIFMILSGIHFGLIYQLLTGQIRDFFKSTVVQYYLAALFIGTSLVAINIYGAVYPDWWTSLRMAAFQVTSVGTSTGFANADSSIWPGFSQLILIFFTLQCACSGSTSGGIKADRMILFWKSLLRRVMLLRHPRAVVAIKVNNNVVDDDIIESVLTFILIYLTVLMLSTVVITGFGIDIMTAISGVAAAMGNVGPGFSTIGSLDNYGHLPNAVKWILSFDMLIGRMEIFGLILFVTIKRWR